jgi:hypothetical protein
VRVGDESWLSSGGGAKGDEITKVSSEGELQWREGKVGSRQEGGRSKKARLRCGRRVMMCDVDPADAA